jgi:hypothetical protein
MADRYWISNANSNANVSTNWADNPDGTGANTVPVATDIVHFGHATTIANDLGAGICTWDLNIALDEMYVYEGYNDIQFISEEISFSGSVITLPQDADTLAIRQGMRITITNSTSNDGTYTITSVSNADLTVSSSLTTEAAGATITLEYFASIDISSDFETNLLSLDGVLENTGGVLKTITLRGTPKVSSGSRYVLNGNNQGVRNRDKIAYDYRAKDSTPAYNDKILFDNGVYPIVKSTNGGTNFSSEYSIPTGDIFLYTDIYSLELTSSGCEFSKPASSSFTSQKNTEKQFYLQTTSNFAMDFTPFDAGFSTWTFKLDATNFNFPVTADTTNYGDSGIFTANWYNVVLDTSTAGYKATIPENRTLNLNSITIQPNTVLQGYFTINENKTSTIVCVARPKILGSWNFSQLADGVYVSLIGDALPITPAHSVAGRVQLSDGHGTFTSDSKLTWASATSELIVNGKLTVTGLIDPTGIVFSPQASNPELTNPLDTIWIDSETNHLFRGDRNVEATVHFNVRNDEGATIPVGSPLYSKGEIGGSNRIKVGIADASDPNKMPAIGLAMQEMNTTSTKDGNMILTGILNENITITGVAEQDIIYVAAHGGTAPYLTITRPTSPSHLVQNVGVCVRQAAANVSQGMKVAAIGRTNDSPNCSFLMVNTESTHPQARRLVAGTNITLTDGGAGGDLTIALPPQFPQDSL